MDKLQMAHEYALSAHKNPNISATHNPEDLASRAWRYADAMQAEADKRKETGLPEATKCHLGKNQEEWQPDWSQAPEDACCWFIGGESWDIKPYWSKYIPCHKSATTQTTWQGNGMVEAPSFNYQGDWKDSLRKRPE